MDGLIFLVGAFLCFVLVFAIILAFEPCECVYQDEDCESCKNP